MAWCSTLDQARALPVSQSPMVADGGAVMGHPAAAPDRKLFNIAQSWKFQELKGRSIFRKISTIASEATLKKTGPGITPEAQPMRRGVRPPAAIKFSYRVSYRRCQSEALPKRRYCKRSSGKS
jgi:hypothetical protein